MSYSESGDTRAVRQPLVIQLLKSAIFFVLSVVLLFVPAGRLDWWAGWAFLISFLAGVSLLAAWVGRHDPDLMAERTSRAENVELWDQVIMGVYTVLLVVLLVVAALDAGRFGWSSVPLPVRTLGWLGLAAALLLVWRVMAANTYLSERVRIQEERGHQVVTTGPYRHVRHPMYVGVILAVLSVPLALGSWWALVAAALIAVLFVVRTALEDRTLQEKLPGYREYAARVRYRLLPGLW